MGGTGAGFIPGSNASPYARLFSDVYAGLYPALRDTLDRLAAFSRSETFQARE